MTLQLLYKVEKSFVTYWVTITPQALSAEHLSHTWIQARIFDAINK